MSKTTTVLVALLFLALPAASTNPPGTSKLPAYEECDLEIHTFNVWADKEPNSDATDFEIVVRNPFADRACSIWQFIVLVDTNEEVELSAGWTEDPDKIAIAGVPNAADWVTQSHGECASPTTTLTPAGNIKSGTCSAVVFTAPQKSEMRPGGFATLYLSANVDQNRLYCDHIPIGVVGVHLRKESNIHTHTDQTAVEAGRPEGRQFELIVDDGLEPLVLPQFSYMWDDDHNGHVDHVYVQWNKEMDPATAEVGDWDVGGKTESNDPYPVLKINVVDPPEQAPANEYCDDNSGVIIKFDEEDRYDTGGDEEGIMPEVTFRLRQGASGLDRHIHEILSTIGGIIAPSQEPFNPDDRAMPVLVSAIIKRDVDDPEFNTRVLVTFSEPVQARDPLCEDAGTALTSSDLRITWRSSSPSPTDPANDLYFEDASAIARIYPPHLLGQTRFWLEFDGPEVLPQDRIQQQDLEFRFEQQQSHNVIEPNAQPHRILPGNDVCDDKGNRAWQHCPGVDQAGCLDAWEPFAEPSIISVDGNIGFNKVTVRFSTAVNMTAALIGDPGQLFTVIEGRGPSGVTGMEFTPGSDKAILTLDAPLKPEDVTGDETFLRIMGGQIWATFSEQNNGTDDPIPWYLPTQDQGIVDVTPPSIMFALTRDLDSNGRLDAYELRISEPVVDLRFVEGSPGDPGVVLNIEGHDTYRRIDVGTTNDANLTIGFQPNTALGGYATHRLPQFLALRAPNSTGLGPGLITDQAVDPNFPDLVIGNWMENVTSEDVLELDGAPPVVMDAFTIDRDENGLIDGFVVIFSEPIKDSTFDPGHWTIIHPQDKHIYTVKGLLPVNADDPLNEWDYYPNDPLIVIDIAERPRDPQRPISILDSMGDTGIPVPDIRYFAPLGEGIEDLAELPTNVGPIFLGGPNRMLNFGTTKVVERDESRPVLVRGLGCEGFANMALYFSEGVGVVDVPGQPMRAIQEQDLFYSNGNGANVGGEPAASGFKTDSVRHNVGDAVLYVELDGPLHADDFVKDRIRIVQHPTHDPEVPDRSVVREVGGTLHTLNESADFRPAADVWPPDPVTDARIQVNANGADMITAASVTLQWTIPKDDGCLDAGIVAYDIRAQDMDLNGTPLSPANFRQVQNPVVFGVEYTWYDAVKEMNRTSTSPGALLKDYGVGEGKVLQARVYGLTPDTNYQLAIRPMDNASNTGPMSPVIEFKTLKDPTPPVKPPGWNLTSPTHPRGVAVKDPHPKFIWGAALDNETIFPWYTYDVTTQAEHKPDPAGAGKKRIGACLNGPCNVTLDAKAVAEITPGRATGLAPTDWYDPAATWYFHLSACSGGGCTLLDSYQFRVDSPVNRTEMLAVNNQINYTVDFDEASKTTRVAWSLPSGSVLPDACIESKPGAQKRFEGVQVWRRGETGEYVLLGTFGTDSNAYRSQTFIDASDNATAKGRYLVTGYCPDLAVTFYDPASNSFKGALVGGPGLFPDGRSPTTDDYPGTAASVTKAPPNLLWLWILLGVLLLLVIVGLIAYMTMRGRGNEERWEEGEIEEEESSMGSPTDEAGRHPGEDGADAPPADDET